MGLRESRRAVALETIADHMLEKGLAPSSLRALAAAARTSDRMLLYYFADKDDIIVSALETISLRLARLLLAALPAGPALDFETALTRLAATLRSDAFRPFMRLWVELVTLAAHGEEPFRTVAGQMADGFHAWAASQLDGPDEATRRAAAARLIATVDGLVLLDLVGRPETATLAVGD